MIVKASVWSKADSFKKIDLLFDACNLKYLRYHVLRRERMEESQHA
ncbi:hypothetical protein [Gracilibacillus oryzae]|nr:hypothetical protein [Gracilibacillus oryzae]